MSDKEYHLRTLIEKLERENTALREEIYETAQDLAAVKAENKALGKSFDRLASMANRMRYNMEYEPKDK